MDQRRSHTGRRELAIKTFAHNTLETHAGADEPESNKRECVCPSWVATHTCYTAFVALPDNDCSTHSEEGLDECAKHHPKAGLAPNLIPNATNERAEEEGDKGAQRLLVGNVEGHVICAVEEPCEGDGKLRKSSTG